VPLPREKPSSLTKSFAERASCGSHSTMPSDLATAVVPPLVSVIIPTRDRPELVLRALKSALDQTLAWIEVIIVVDGPDDETVACVRGIADPRLQLVVNPSSITAAGARNTGAALARGEWIAFLDDDDQWLPQKLEQQMAAAGADPDVMVSCLSRVVTPNGTYVWPEEVYEEDIPLADYLFNRPSLFAGASFMQTSSYLIRRTAFQKSPFRLGTPHDDWDFLLRFVQIPGARIKVVSEVLVEVRFEQRQLSLSSRTTWRESLAWIDEITPMLTRGAYSGLCLGVAGSKAAYERAYAAFPLLLYKAVIKGDPRPLQILRFISFWLLPQELRRRIRPICRNLLKGCTCSAKAEAGVRRR